MHVFVVNLYDLLVHMYWWHWGAHTIATEPHPYVTIPVPVLGMPEEYVWNGLLSNHKKTQRRVRIWIIGSVPNYTLYIIITIIYERKSVCSLCCNLTTSASPWYVCLFPQAICWLRRWFIYTPTCSSRQCAYVVISIRWEMLVPASNYALNGVSM